MLCKPTFWAKQPSGLPATLYGMVIQFRPSKPLVRGHAKLILLTRDKLPVFPAFPLFLDCDIETTIQTVLLDTSFSVTPEELTHLSNFTISVFHDIFHKTFDLDPEKFPYWLAPVQPKAEVYSSATSPRVVVDWDTLLFVHEKRELRWTPEMSADSLVGKFLYDDWDGRKRYFPLAVDDSLHASDPPPSYVPRRKWMENILNYTLSLSKNSRPKFLEGCDWKQPVYQAECICLRRNFLDRTTAAERSENTQSVICPQPLTISPVRVFPCSCFNAGTTLLITCSDSCGHGRIMPSIPCHHKQTRVLHDCHGRLPVPGTRYQSCACIGSLHQRLRQYRGPSIPADSCTAGNGQELRAPRVPRRQFPQDGHIHFSFLPTAGR